MNASAASILDGLTVGIQWQTSNSAAPPSTAYQPASGPATAVVGAQSETSLATVFGTNKAMEINVDTVADTITFTCEDNGKNNPEFTNDAFNGYDFSVISSFTGFASVSVASYVWPTYISGGYNDPAFNPNTAVTFNNNNIYVNFAALVTGTPADGDFVTLAYTFNPSTPEPASFCCSAPASPLCCSWLAGNTQLRKVS